MSDVWIANASPLIVLAKVGQLELLSKLAPTLLVPDAVVKEVTSGPPSDPARRSLERGWGNTASAKTVPDVLREWGLGSGETAVLALAKERASAIAVLDDAAARACARTMRVPVIGTLGVVLRARRRGLITSAAIVVKAIQAEGLYLDDSVIAAALRHVGESWDVVEDRE